MYARDHILVGRCILAPQATLRALIVFTANDPLMLRHYALLFVLMTTTAWAQTIYIPDTYLRTWLNNAQPGSVDVDGFIDATAWNANPPGQVEFSFHDLPDSYFLNLQGIEFLNMYALKMVDDEVPGATIVSWPGPPQLFFSLEVINVDLGLFQGFEWPTPAMLDQFSCTRCGLTTIPEFQGTFMSFYEVDFGGQVPAIPPTLTNLELTGCNLGGLPPLPALTNFTLKNDTLDAFPALPASLYSLTTEYAGLDVLPTLPPGLVNLRVRNGHLTELPDLPAGLQLLDVTSNFLLEIPPLPNGLLYLTISYNPITWVGPWPETLHNFVSYSCPLDSLPALPPTLNELHAWNGNFDELPALPPTLHQLGLRNCEQLTCLPILPPDLYALRLAGSGVTCLPNIPALLNLDPGTIHLGIDPIVCNAANSPCPLVDPLITGTVFLDPNSNGMQDVGEAPRPNATVIAQPGDLMSGSDQNGYYVLPAGIGSFTVTGTPMLYGTVTTPDHDVVFTGLGEIDSLNHVGYHMQPDVYDLVTHLMSGAMRPGFDGSLWITVQNVGTEAATPQVQLTHDADLTYLSSSATPTVNANVLTWDPPSLAPGEQWTVHVLLHCPASVPLGTPLQYTATADPGQPDATPLNNTVARTDEVVGAYDPNDKQAEPATMSPAEVMAGERITYTIRFQNTGNYPAERVLITDTLESGLQWSSLQPIAASHAHHWYLHNGVLHILFENINLPDSTSDEPGSHGFFRFSMVPQPTLLAGDQVHNSANIYFDFNEPVITNDAVFSVEIHTGLSSADGLSISAWPQPFDEHLTISGALNGASIRLYDAVGRVVASIQGTANMHELNTSDLGPGLYVLTITDGGSGTVIKPLVKR